MIIHMNYGFYFLNSIQPAQIIVIRDSIIAIHKNHTFLEAATPPARPPAVAKGAKHARHTIVYYREKIKISVGELVILFLY